MSSFANLMALSATNTRQSQLAVESALQERRRKEALQRKQQEEREAKEREQEKKLRLRRLEEQKREQERQLRLEQERQAKALALQRKEEAQRVALRHGPKKAAQLAAAGAAAGSSGSGGGGPKWPVSASAAAKAARALDDSDGESPGLGLTREELRKKKQEAELRKMYKESRKPTQSSKSSNKNGLRLPGGALNVVKPEDEEEDPASTQGSVRDRLLNKPNMLTKLNTVKKDQRTVFEQLDDARAAKKVLEGHEALNFDWWSSSKKKETEKKTSPAPRSSTAPPSTNSPAPREFSGWLYRFIANFYILCTGPKSSLAPAPPQSSSISALQKNSVRAPPKSTSTKSSLPPSHKRSATASRASSSDIPTSSSQNKVPKVKKSTTASAASSSAPRGQSISTSQGQRKAKRPRSPSLSESPPPSKKHHLDSSFSTAIWSIFGKDRSKYTSRDVLSDDEDMEVDATFLEREETISARIAHKEDLLEAEEERRRAEEKKRKARARGH
ncbi:hypothetical protein M413DRAFT_19846 [Hebeloma cylindrosporum]|uniref:SPT2 chromatin protein n=1 Tax=Hebeloma cylindrosporum TaxID=76867 RepID=A0A0C3C714_HEBCY|nr:hypothetical protein M413DRAFT_19846 [Hebeloma cylindrosporum h7]